MKEKFNSSAKKRKKSQILEPIFIFEKKTNISNLTSFWNHDLRQNNKQKSTSVFRKWTRTDLKNVVISKKKKKTIEQNTN